MERELKVVLILSLDCAPLVLTLRIPCDYLAPSFIHIHIGLPSLLVMNLCLPVMILWLLACCSNVFSSHLWTERSLLFITLYPRKSFPLGRHISKHLTRPIQIQRIRPQLRGTHANLQGHILWINYWTWNHVCFVTYNVYMWFQQTWRRGHK